VVNAAPDLGALSMSIADAVAAPLVDARKPAPIVPANEPSIRLHGVPWDAYIALRAPEGNNALRMTYDRGDLEIMSPSGKHAKVSWLLGFMICEWTLARGLKMSFGGDMTLRRSDITRGLEADQCYWLANEAKVRGKDEIDLLVDPPPDLAIEVEVTNPLVPKLPIYQALAVSEVWWWHNESLSILTLDRAQGYVERPDSVALPGFPLRLAEEVVRRRQAESATDLLLRIRAEIAEITGT
jgi:Uma2 family endonuclease